MILTQRSGVDLATHFTRMTAVLQGEPLIFTLALTTEYRGEFVEHLRQTWVAQQTVTQFVAMIALNLVTTKAEAEHDLLFNEPTSVHSPGSSVVKLLRLLLICTVVI